MARQEVVVYSFSCDVCGKAIPDDERAGANRKVTFGGRTYDLDLCKKDQAGLDKAVGALHAYLDAGRAVSAARRGGRSRRPASSCRGRRSRGGPSEVREWARANGWPNLGTRGRIPADAMAAYDAATK